LTEKSNRTAIELFRILSYNKYSTHIKGLDNMKFRVNFLLIVNDEPRAKSRIVEAADSTTATNIANKLLTDTYGKEDFKITTVKPW
jgi:hypothetical protein